MARISRPNAATLDMLVYLVGRKVKVNAHPEQIRDQVFRLMPETRFTEKARVMGLFHVLRTFRAEARFWSL